MPIEKRKLDEKTYELYNTDRAEPLPIGPTPITQAAQEVASGNLQAQMFDEWHQRDQAVAKHLVKGEEGGWAKATSVDDFLQAAKEASPERKQLWRKQFSTFDKTLKKNQDPNVPIEGIQEMLDTGAIYMDDDGNVYSSVPGRGGPKRNERLLGAAREWGDWYRDQLAYGEDVAPNGRASVEMDNILKMGQRQQAWEYDASSGGYAK